MAILTKPKSYICIEAFAVTLASGDVWFKVGQRVLADHEVFKGESGRNRKEGRLFRPLEEGE